MRLLVIEGVVASGKTSVFTHLQTALSETKANVSKFFVTEHISQRVFECIDDISIKKAHIRNHLNEIVGFIKHLENIYSNSKFKDGKKELLIICIERFLLSYLVDKLIDDDFASEVLSELSVVNLTQFLLMIPENQILRRIESTLNFRNDVWIKYLHELSSRVNIEKHFNKQQKKMKDWALKFSSKMATHSIDTSMENYKEYAARILEFL